MNLVHLTSDKVDFDMYHFICPACGYEEFFDIRVVCNIDPGLQKGLTSEYFCEGCGQPIEIKLEDPVKIEDLISTANHDISPRKYPDKDYELECPHCKDLQTFSTAAICKEIGYKFLDGKEHTDWMCGECENEFTVKFDIVPGIKIQIGNILYYEGE